MHHYGEMEVKVETSEKTFNILLKNHVTGAEINVSGPIKGVFESKEPKLDQMVAEEIGREISHVLKRVLTVSPQNETTEAFDAETSSDELLSEAEEEG